MQFEAGKEMAPFDRTDMPTEKQQEAKAAQREKGDRRQGEDDTLDWAAAVTVHAEDWAETMDLSTENLSEMEESGQETTQENVTSRKTSAMDESGQGEDHSTNDNKQEQNQGRRMQKRASLVKR
jgi:hypothetical protein